MTTRAQPVADRVVLDALWRRAPLTIALLSDATGYAQPYLDTVLRRLCEQKKVVRLGFQHVRLGGRGRGLWSLLDGVCALPTTGQPAQPAAKKTKGSGVIAGHTYYAQLAGWGIWR